MLILSVHVMNDKIRRALRATMISVTMWFGLSGVANGDDLWAIYQLALTRDAIYGAANYQYQSAILALPLARSTLLPTISIQGSVQRKRSDDTTPVFNDAGSKNRSSLNADLSILNISSLYTYSQAKLQAIGAQINFADARAELILRIADRYFGVLAAMDNREVAHRQKTAIQRQMDLAIVRLEVGIGTRTDLFDAQARFQQSVADLIQADNQIDNAVQALKQITGEITGQESANALASLDQNAPLTPPNPQSPAVWVERALNNNRALMREDLNLKVAAKEIKKQQALRFPRLDLNFRRDWRESDDVTNNFGGEDSQNNGGRQETDSRSVTATLNWSLYSGGAANLKIKEAGLQFNAAERIREQMKRQVESDTTSAYRAVVGGASQVKALSEAIRAGVSALRAKQEGFRAGLTTNLDVLDAQRDLSRSRTDHLRAKYDLILSTLHLERAAGDLDEADVKRINGWLVGGS